MNWAVPLAFAAKRDLFHDARQRHWLHVLPNQSTGLTSVLEVVIVVSMRCLFKRRAERCDEGFME
jgi:hypothetical protein